MQRRLELGRGLYLLLLFSFSMKIPLSVFQAGRVVWVALCPGTCGAKAMGVVLESFLSDAVLPVPSLPRSLFSSLGMGQMEEEELQAQPLCPAEHERMLQRKVCFHDQGRKYRQEHLHCEHAHKEGLR